MADAGRTRQWIDSTVGVGQARALIIRLAHEFGRSDVADDAALVASELVTNALLHGGGCRDITVVPVGGGLRIEVRDGSRVPPMLGFPSEESLTGRGLRLVASLADAWGAEMEPDGKVLWAEVSGGRVELDGAQDVNDLLAMWAEDVDLGTPSEPTFRVELGGVPTDLLLAAKSHVDNLVREFTLASSGARDGQSSALPQHLGVLLAAVIDRFAETRLAIKQQALGAASRGEASTQLTLHLPARAAEAAQDYVEAIDEVDAYCRARRLLTLESPPQHRVFRHWYVDQLISQLHAAAGKGPARLPQTFERRLLAEIDAAAAAHRAAERAARLYSVTVALASATTPESVAQAVLTEGLAALGASGGGLLLSTNAGRLDLPGAVGYDEEVVARLRNQSLDAELPAAEALRTGLPVWLETPTERDQRFPQLVGLEATTIALCAVPLAVEGRLVGALRFSFTEARLFDDDERHFTLALAAQTAQALERAQLQRAKADISRRLQHSLVPPTMPDIPGLETGALYRASGAGMDVGGDFYDLWTVDAGRWAFAIGDVAGCGPEAAALTALVRHTLRALAFGTSNPGTVMTILNRVLVDAATPDDGERLCTAIFGFVTAGDGFDVWLASGGHPWPLLRRADGTTAEQALGGSPLLGVFPDVDVQTRRLHLGAGDTLVLVTDGVLQARAGDHEFDVEGLDRVVAGGVTSAAAVVSGIEAAVLDHTGGRLDDDMAALVLHVPTAG